jgi:hypothetical protein
MQENNVLSSASTPPLDDGDAASDSSHIEESAQPLPVDEALAFPPPHGEPVMPTQQAHSSASYGEEMKEPAQKPPHKRKGLIAAFAIGGLLIVASAATAIVMLVVIPSIEASNRVDQVEELIEDIGAVALGSKGAVEAAERAYYELDGTLRSRVSNRDTLFAAVDKLEKAEEAAQDKLERAKQAREAEQQAERERRLQEFREKGAGSGWGRIEHIDKGHLVEFNLYAVWSNDRRNFLGWRSFDGSRTASEDEAFAEWDKVAERWANYLGSDVIINLYSSDNVLWYTTSAQY